jgi:hypothetical protein
MTEFDNCLNPKYKRLIATKLPSLRLIRDAPHNQLAQPIAPSARMFARWTLLQPAPMINDTEALPQVLVFTFGSAATVREVRMNFLRLMGTVCFVLINAEANAADEPIYTKVRFSITESGNFAGQVLRNLGTPEAAALVTAGCAAFGVDCSGAAAAGAEAIKQVFAGDSKDGNEHRGIYRAPQNYEICQAKIDWGNTGIDGGSTFAARLQRDNQNHGLGYYAVVPTGGGRGHGITSDLYLMFVLAGQVPQRNCFPTNALLWNCKGPQCGDKDPMSDSYGIYPPARK